MQISAVCAVDTDPSYGQGYGVAATGPITAVEAGAEVVTVIWSIVDRRVSFAVFFRYGRVTGGTESSGCGRTGVTRPGGGRRRAAVPPRTPAPAGSGRPVGRRGCARRVRRRPRGR